ncbi:MAG TPA: hypothetical protein PLF71_03940 [bacterium]|nr:MAG: hypothetical protein BWY14_00860 [Parcubacteria group bacterium ADurb.Bin192]HPN15234.1 hypothetical protein [bacterium]
MIHTENCLIIMDPGYEVLGEVYLAQGMCRSISLNQRGDQLLGVFIEDWQVHGLERMQQSLVQTKEGPMDMFSAEKVSLQSQDFASALRGWLDDHGFLHHTLPLGAMAAWSEIQKKDLDNRQKLELALMLASLPVEKLEL